MPEKKVNNTVPVLLIVLALLACVPVVGAVVASMSSMGTIANGGKTAGFVTVSSCGTTWLVVPQCRGTFTSAETSDAAGAQPSFTLNNVRLANDIRLHDTGARVSASLNIHNGRAYVSGWVPILIGVVAILVVLFVLVATFATLFRVFRGHQVVLPGPILTLALAVILAALLIVPLADHTGTGG